MEDNSYSGYFKDSQLCGFGCGSRGGSSVGSAVPHKTVTGSDGLNSCSAVAYGEMQCYRTVASCSIGKMIYRSSGVDGISVTMPLQTIAC